MSIRGGRARLLSKPERQPSTYRMKYVCLVYADEHALREISDPECARYSADLNEQGKRLGGEALESIDTATTVRVREGKVTITDGPFAETKEQLAGFYLIDAHDL